MILLHRLYTFVRVNSAPNKNRVVRLLCSYKLRQSNNNFSEETKELPLIYGVLGELKFRLLYISLVSTSLLGLIYLNLGLYIEFQGSYYLNYYQFIDFDWYEGVKELNQSVIINPSRDICFSDKKSSSLLLGNRLNEVKITIEIDEFKNFFISTVNYFSGQVKLFIDFSEGNTSQLLKKQSSLKDQQLIFSIYMMFLFYQLTALLSYHFFCFLGPGLLKQSRVKLFQGLQMLFLTLLLHFLLLPHVITIYEELQIESLDSELFFSAPFNLLNSWVQCFYFLLIALTLLLFFLSYVFPYAAAPYGFFGVRSLRI